MIQHSGSKSIVATLSERREQGATRRSRPLNSVEIVRAGEEDVGLTILLHDVLGVSGTPKLRFAQCSRFLLCGTLAFMGITRSFT
jgi:hypothetical protein